MDFLLTTDSNYLRYLYVVMESVYENHTKYNGSLNFHILSNDLNEEDKKDIGEFAKAHNSAVFFYYIDDKLFTDFPIGKSWAISCMYILFAHAILPKTIHRVLYLDIDLVVNGNLEEFYNLDFEGHYLIASKEWYDAKNEPKEPFSKFEKVTECSKEIAARGGYLNSGVLLFNLDKFREDKIDLNFYKEKLKGYKNVFYDQGVICICFAQSIKLLTTCKYNYRLGFSISDYYKKENRYKNEIKSYQYYPVDAKIIHYCGFTGIKPWNLLLTKKLIPNAEQTFFEMVPENIEYSGVWWKYAKNVPERIYNSIHQDAKINTAAYQILWGALYYRGFSLQNLMKVETLCPPNWRDRNSVARNSDLNDYILPKTYICTRETANTVYNLPKEIKGTCSFRLVVKQLAIKAGDKTPLMQVLEVDSADAAIYRRYSDNNGKNWFKWKRLLNDGDRQEIFDEIKLLKERIDTKDEEDKKIEALQRVAEDLIKDKSMLMVTIEEMKEKEIINDRQLGSLKEENERNSEKIDDFYKKYTIIEQTIKELTHERDVNKQQISMLSNRYDDAKNEVISLKTSLSFRIGRAVTFLPRKIRDVFKKK